MRTFEQQFRRAHSLRRTPEQVVRRQQYRPRSPHREAAAPFDSFSRLVLAVTVLVSIQVSICESAEPPSLAATSESFGSRLWQTVEQGNHHRVIESASRTTDRSKPPGLASGRFTLLGNGINRKDDSGNWIECKPVVQIYPAGIVCTGAGYRVLLSSRLTPQGVVDLETPDQKRITSNPLGIGFFDPVSGRSVLLAQIKDSQAEVSSNGIVFRDAFEGSGIEAAITYRYEVGHFCQDVTFVTRPSVTPADFDMSERTRLEVLTEILECPEPNVTVHFVRHETNATARATMAEPDLADETIRFGDEMMITPGRAFHSDATAAARRGVPVLKRLVRVDDRLVLVEAVEWQAARPELEKLPRRSASARMPERQPSLKRRLPDRGMAKNTRDSFSVRLARARQPGFSAQTAINDSPQVAGGPGPSTTLPRGFVVDYSLVQSGNDITFQSGQTYLITNSVVIIGLTIESGAVVKFSPGASLTVGDTLCGPGSTPKVVFTAIDDDSAGQTIPWSTGHPSGRYAEYAMTTYYLSYPYWNFLDIRYAQTGLKCYSGEHNVSSSWFFECDTGVVADYSTITLDSSDFCQVDTWYEGLEDVNNLTECLADRDGDSLPDNWEHQYFGSLSQNGGGDFDGDGVSNYVEWLLGRNPAAAGTVPDTYNTLKLRTLKPWP